MKPTVVFVDDEPQVLNGLRRSLRTKRDDWDMHFIAGGVEALRFMATTPIDVMVSDMRMPDIDGATVMQSTREHAPSAVRFILSGQAEREATFRTIGCSHRFLAKPTDTAVIINAIDDAVAWRTHPDYDVASWRAEHVSQLAVCMLASQALATALGDADPHVGPDLDHVAAIIERDPAMTFALLQLVNSAYFGPGRPALRAREALNQLGVATLTDLVRENRFAGQSFVQDTQAPNTDTDAAPRAGAEPSPHDVAQAAHQLACDDPDMHEHADLAFVCGLLMRLGDRVNAAPQSPDAAAQSAINTAQSDRSPRLSSARPPRALHTPIAAYMCALAGLPKPVCDALTWLAPINSVPDLAHGAAAVLAATAQAIGCKPREVTQ